MSAAAVFVAQIATMNSINISNGGYGIIGGSEPEKPKKPAVKVKSPLKDLNVFPNDSYRILKIEECPYYQDCKLVTFVGGKSGYKRVVYKDEIDIFASRPENRIFKVGI